MLFNHDLSSVVKRRPFLPATHPLPLEPDRSANGHIRELLRFHGLRTSLFRIKVINALVLATLEGRAIGVCGVRAYLESSSVELTLVSVREVLKRLAEEGVIVFQADKSYRFTTEAWGMLKPHLG
jgi:Fe2+ or Zn2+ uptake regulation protein